MCLCHLLIRIFPAQLGGDYIYVLSTILLKLIFLEYLFYFIHFKCQILNEARNACIVQQQIHIVKAELKILILLK